MGSTDTVYPSRVDLWLVLLVTGAVGFTLYQPWTSHAVSPRESVFVATATVAVFTLLLALSWPCSYTLTDSHLVIRSGLIRQRIAYRDIIGAEPSNSLWAAPALSLRRVRVRLAGRFVLVSPTDRAGFIEDLTHRVERVRAGQPGAA